MPLSLAKKYRTRCGYPVTAMVYTPPTNPEKSDGFPWQATYRLPDGRIESCWYDFEGQWSRNRQCISDLDLVEIQ